MYYLDFKKVKAENFYFTHTTSISSFNYFDFKKNDAKLELSLMKLVTLILTLLLQNENRTASQ